MNFRQQMEAEFERQPTVPMVPEAMREILMGTVMGAIREAISRVVDVQEVGPARATDAAGNLYAEFGHGIEFPETIGDEGRAILANAFAAATVKWLTDMSGARSRIHGWEGPKIARVVWRVEPEFDVQHTQVPAPLGCTGATVYYSGPWVGMIYMRGSVARVRAE